VPADVPLEVLGRIEQPSIMDWDRAHPIMRHVEFAKVAIEDAMRVRPLAAGRALVETVSGPLIYALEEQDRKAVFVGFDLFKTDFPLRVAFPLILSNTLRWLHPAALDQSSLQLAAGQPILLPVAHGITRATVTTPSGRSIDAPVTRGVVSFTETEEVGVYALGTARGDMRLAINLMDAEESNLAPRPRRAARRAARRRRCRSSGSCGRCSSSSPPCCWPPRACSTGAGRRRAACAYRRRRATSGRWRCAAPSSSCSW
jgi:hypothetical protein